MRKFLFVTIFLGLHVMARGQTSGYDYYYWFDNDPTTLHQGHAAGGQWQLQPDISQLSKYLHALNIQVVDADGRWSQPVRRTFLKVADLSRAKGYWWIDDNAKETNVQSQWQGAFDIDVSQLTTGMHTFYYQVRDEREAFSPPVARHFMKMPTSSGSEAMRAFYWFDNEMQPREATPVQGLMEIDASQLTDGMHAFHYQLTEGGSTFSTPVTRFFVKTSGGGTNAIAEYRYWLNDQVPSQGHRVVLSEHKPLLELVTMLQMSQQPLRSKYFYFEMTDGQPTVYPVNDLHLRFYDTNNNYTDTVARYADLSAGQRVNEVAQLQPGVRETTASPAANVIKWYKLEATAGDDLRLRLSHEATLQLFAPSGEEVLSIEGTTEWAEMQAWESGTYYAALHDVANAEAVSVSIDYERNRNTIQGDVNNDGAVNIGDVVMVINVMTGAQTDAAIVARADVNGNGTPDVGDIVNIISIMTTQPAAVRANVARQAVQQATGYGISLSADGSVLRLALDNAREYTAFQLQLTLPEGSSVGDATVSQERGNGHRILVEPLGDGQFLVMGFSLVNASFSGNSGELVTLSLKGRQPDCAWVDNVVFADANGQTYGFAGSEATGIGSLQTDYRRTNNDRYDLQGRKATMTKKGIILIGDRKVVVK